VDAGRGGLGPGHVLDHPPGRRRHPVLAARPARVPDSELPHNEPPEPNFDGPAPEQSSTAPTSGLPAPPLISPPDPVQPALPPPSGPAVGLLPLKPVSALPAMGGIPRHALLPGPHGAPTYHMGGSPKPGPFGAASDPGLTAA